MEEWDVRAFKSTHSVYGIANHHPNDPYIYIYSDIGFQLAQFPSRRKVREQKGEGVGDNSIVEKVFLKNAQEKAAISGCRTRHERV